MRSSAPNYIEYCTYLRIQDDWRLTGKSLDIQVHKKGRGSESPAMTDTVTANLTSRVLYQRSYRPSVSLLLRYEPRKEYPVHPAPDKVSVPA